MPEKLRFSLQGTRKTDEGNGFRRAIVAGEIEKIWKECPGTVAFSAAGKVFEQMLDEFLKNSADAGANFIDFSVAVENNIITIQIIDDGTTAIPEGKFGQYKWRKALLEKSQKSPKNQLGGKNLGLAIAAHFLETQGQGELHLTNNPNGRGVTVILKSSDKNLGDLYIMPENFNYLHKMIEDAHKNMSVNLSREIIIAPEEKKMPTPPPAPTTDSKNKKKKPPSLFTSLPPPFSALPLSPPLQPLAPPRH